MLYMLQLEISTIFIIYILFIYIILYRHIIIAIYIKTSGSFIIVK